MEEISLRKRFFRFVMRRLPTSKLSFNLGKMITRTWLTPERASTITHMDFAKTMILKVDLGEFVCNDIYCLDAHFESASLRLWQRLAKQAKSILDLGSHVGTFALMAGTVNPDARIVAVEACPRNLDLLYANVSTNPNIRVCPKAVGGYSGRGLFTESRHTGGGYLDDNSLSGSERRGCEGGTSTSSYWVDVIELVKICEDAGFTRVDLMKLDLEGVEFDILNGEEEFWDRWKPRHVLAEICVLKSEKAKLDMLLHRMSDRGYSYQMHQNLFAFPWKEKQFLANWHFWLPCDKYL